MLFRRLNWNVVGWFNIVSYISYAIILAGVISMIYHYATTGSALRLGLSFTGGTDLAVKFKQPVTTDAIRTALGTVGVSDAQINTLSKPGEPAGERYAIETQKDFGDASIPLWNALGGVAPVDRTASSISAVGPSLSHEYLWNAIKALVIAIAIQFLYIAFRFGWNYIFGLVTIIALVRDSAMMIGIYSIAGKRVDDAFLAAVLTVIGYSVMDTIVILDRIRENTKLMSGDPFDRIVNTSILQTMARSVNTLATVIITLVALLALGGASLQNFAFALLVGICSGGYHSIFYSAPLVARLQERFKRTARVSTVAPARTVAEARAQGSPNLDRAEVLAARKARQERERLGKQRVATPAKYKRRRIETTGAVGIIEPDISEQDQLEQGDDVELTHDEAHDAHVHELAMDHEGQIDPLDAQSLGLHDRDYELGHEAITLNLDAGGPAPEHPAPLEHPAEPEHPPVHEQPPTSG